MVGLHHWISIRSPLVGRRRGDSWLQSQRHERVRVYLVVLPQSGRQGGGPLSTIVNVNGTRRPMSKRWNRSGAVEHQGGA